MNTTNPAADFDVSALADWLGPRIQGFTGPLQAKRFAGGQSNPTYLLVDAAGTKFVLRKKPGGQLLPSAHAVDREFRVMKALEGTEVPVARMLCYCEDASVIGTEFYVMEFVTGRIFWDPTLPELPVEQRRPIYSEMTRVVAALHGVDYEAVGLASYGRPENFLGRQIARWTKQYQASATESIPSMDRLIEWLPAHLPSDQETAIFHGDLRIDNMIFHPTEPRILSVLDWELSTLGHPIADFAYHAMPWRLRSDEFRGMAEKDLAAEGIPSEQEYLRAYAAATSRTIDPDLYEFCVAYSMFRLAAILQGILKRSLDGNAASTEARETGLRARSIADAAWRQVAAHFGEPLA